MPVIFQPVRTWRFAAQLLPNALASAALTLGILALAVSVWIVVHTYSPVLFWDQWEIVRTLMKSHGHFTLRDLWAQHNEHRVVTGRLFGFADLYWFGGRNVSLYVEIIGLQLCHLLLLIYLVRRFGRLPPAVYATVVGFLAYCLFSPIQMENFIWAFQTVFILTSLAATACCAAALIHADRGAGGEGKRKPIWLFIAVLCAFTAEVTEAHGLVTWPVLLFLAFALRFSPRDRIIVFVAAGVAITAYMIGYHSPDSPQALTGKGAAAAREDSPFRSDLPGEKLGSSSSEPVSLAVGFGISDRGGDCTDACRRGPLLTETACVFSTSDCFAR